MGEVRACVYFSVLFLCFQIGIAKPLFGTRFWCDFLCDDDDISTTTTASNEDDYYDWCSDCPVRRPRTTTTRAPPIFGPMQNNQPPFNFMIPPGGNGMNINWIPNPNPNQGGWWGFYISPNTATPAPGMQPPAPPPVPPVPGAPTPAPPAATPGATPAPAATTPAATTAAATTAAAGK